ncbi:hypothetical protein AVEN_160882-1 [Araneus ventricosus]|uniref:Uncharacterized protein n=1 Tax=Araneus ventricosus TaxID=182803 RepID=A0A4Y2GEK8_ARAVE|nr:hypothetical protein AVEN_160882-1 [Araneus ventricosus]
MEKDNTTAFEVSEAHKVLKRNLTERKASNFIPMGAKNINRTLDEQVRNSVKEEFDGFYERCLAYLDHWENSFGNAEQFSWVNLTKAIAVDWENAETSAEIINSSLLDVPGMKINNDQLFDEVVFAKEYLQSNWEQWKQEETTRDVIISSDQTA